MPRSKEANCKPAELVPYEPSTEVILQPPNSGVIGKFLEETANMFKARAMRMGGLLRRINESGQRTEIILRSAAERMEAAEAKLEQDLTKEGLLPASEDEKSLDETLGS
ncbi:MAG: hypothetical protein ACLQPD_27045 [Desulfomonilaceae bacterium]